MCRSTGGTICWQSWRPSSALPWWVAACWGVIRATEWEDLRAEFGAHLWLSRGELQATWSFLRRASGLDERRWGTLGALHHRTQGSTQLWKARACNLECPCPKAQLEKATWDLRGQLAAVARALGRAALGVPGADVPGELLNMSSFG